MEEVAYTRQGRKLPFREPADRRMSYIKAHNLDLYAALILILAVTFSSDIFVSLKVYKQYFRKSSVNKQKLKIF